MRRFLGGAGLLLSATVSWGQPVPPALPIGVPPPPTLPTPAQLMNSDRGPSLLPRRQGPAPDADLVALQRELEQLRAERAALVAERDKGVEAGTDSEPGDAARAARLRARVAELLARLEAKKTRDAKPVSAPAPLPPPTVSAPPTPAPVVVAAELLHQAQEAFRAGQYQAALTTVRRLDAEKLDPGDRAFATYLVAGSLRGLGRLDEAEAQYRAVVDAHGDDDLTQSAASQLRAIETRRALIQELAELRGRP